MDDLPVKHPGPFHQKITLSCKTLNIYLKLLLLLENVKHNQSLMQHCPMRTEFAVFPNFTSEAGSPFFFKLPIPETLGHTQHHQLSLADGDSTLPHWMAFRQQTSRLAGLALTEDCGIYHLKVSIIGEQCAAYFYLHILNQTVTNLERDTLSCSEGETPIWANLLLQLNPVTLDADQRIHLVSTMADYLHLPLHFVYLFSRRTSLLQQEKLRVCRLGGLAEKMTSGNEKQDASGDVAEFLWPVGCRGEEQQSDLATVLEYSVKAGGLAKLLEAPVLGWRVLCAPGGVRHKVKRDLQKLKFTPTPNMIVPPPTVNVKLEYSHIYSPPLTKLEPSLLTMLLDKNDVGTRLELKLTGDSTENTVTSVSKDLLPQVSGTQVDTFPDSPEKAFKFTSEAFETLMYHSVLHPEMPIAVLKTNHMQNIQISSNSPFSIKQTTCTYPYSKDVNYILEHQVCTGKKCLSTLHTSICVEFGCPHPNRFSVHNSQKNIKQAGLSASKTKPLVEVTGCSEQVSEMTSDTSQSISEYFQTTGLCPSTFLPEHLSTVRTLVPADTALSTLLPSSTLHSIYPSLLLTPASYSVTSMLTHEAVDRKTLATRLTLRPHQRETPLWTGSYRASHTDSDSQPTVSSLGHIICNQGPIEGHHTAKPTLLPSVSHPPLTENYNDALLLDRTLKTIQSLPPSNKIPSTQLFPDVSAERLSTIRHSDTIQHLSSVLNQDVMSPLDVTTQSVSSTSVTGQLALSGQTELESSLSTSLFEPTVMTFTPVLPSETPKIINSVFTVESPKASSFIRPLLQTFSKFLLPDIGTSSLQDNLESPLVTDLQSKSGTELCFGQKALMQTLSSDILLTSLQPTYPSWTLHMSSPLTETLSVPLSVIKNEPSKEQPALKSAHEQFMPSVQQTLHTLLYAESQQSYTFYHISLVAGMTANMDLNTAAGPVFMSEDHFDPTAPSTVQEPYTTSFHQLQDLDPSLPLCGQSVMQDLVYVNGCTPQINSTYSENTVEHILDSHSQNEEHWTSFPSQFFLFDSSGQFFSTQTSRNYLSMHPLPSDVLREQAESNKFMSLLLVSTMHLSATTEINQITATSQMDISDTLPSLEGTGFSEITSALSGNYVSSENSLLICQPITLQILSMSSPFYGMSTALLTSLQAVSLSSDRRESSVQPTPSSASISSFMNLPPKVLQSIPVLMATVGFPFHYSIPPKTFQDPEDGNADTLSLEIRLIDGPPVSVGTWLALDGLELHGVPLEVDLQFAPQHLLLAARDEQGLSTWLPLTLDLRRSPVDPCHVFTLTAQRSLHSVLRHRHRVELLLRKLSRFFNSSSSHHLSVVSMRPGSTVVSWYNYSLCEMAHRRVTLCRVDQIRSMWLAMRSTDGSVNPAFRKAMLPEFPITKVGPVSYRRDCFSTTSTPIFDASTPAVHTTRTPGLGTNTSLSSPSNTCISASPAITATSQQITHYQWMAGMFIALLVVCLLILIVLLVATVLHFCKGHGRSRTVAIWPAGRVLSVRSRDRSAIRLRRPPLFQPELPPPPLRLWNLSHGDEGQIPSTRERGWKTIDKVLQPRPPQYDFSSITK